MREVKFRIYDTNRNKFYYSAEDVGNSFPIHEWMGNRASLFLATLQELNGGKGLILQECSGLRDRTGHDIYEGDLLRVEGQPQSGDFNNATYVFEAGRACFTARMIRGEVMREPVIAWMLDGSGKVIGNIWENPHLLKEEHDL